MGYVDYAFYTDVYLGNFIPEREFSHYGLLAKYRLDKFKRMYTVAPAEGDKEKLAMCAMAEAMYKIALAQTGMSDLEKLRSSSFISFAPLLTSDVSSLVSIITEPSALDI